MPRLTLTDDRGGQTSAVKSGSSGKSSSKGGSKGNVNTGRKDDANVVINKGRGGSVKGNSKPAGKNNGIKSKGE
jgi:hypothetical protein